MREGIHPELYEVKVHCACGNEFVTRSTKKTVRLEICYACHPFYTGKQKFVDTAGRIEKFQRKFKLEDYFAPKKPKTEVEPETPKVGRVEFKPEPVVEAPQPPPAPVIEVKPVPPPSPEAKVEPPPALKPVEVAPPPPPPPPISAPAPVVVEPEPEPIAAQDAEAAVKPEEVEVLESAPEEAAPEVETIEAPKVKAKPVVKAAAKKAAASKPAPAKKASPARKTAPAKKTASAKRTAKPAAKKAATSKTKKKS